MYEYCINNSVYMYFILQYICIYIYLNFFIYFCILVFNLMKIKNKQKFFLTEPLPNDKMKLRKFLSV